MDCMHTRIDQTEIAMKAGVWYSHGLQGLMINVQCCLAVCVHTRRHRCAHRVHLRICRENTPGRPLCVSLLGCKGQRSMCGDM